MNDETHSASPNNPGPGFEPGALDPISKEERTWAMFCHLGALAGFVLPFGNLIVPLVIWMLKKDEMPFVADQGKEAVNFQITLSIAFFVSLLLILIVVGILLMYVVAIVGLVLVVIAAIKANEGVRYRYPFALRLIK